MWPDLFGPGWIWGILTALGLLGAFVALIWLLGDFRMPRETPDPVQESRHEQGDLIPPEFEHAKGRKAPLVG